MTDDPVRRLRASWEDNAGAWTRAVRSGAIESRRLATDDAIVHAVLRCTPRTVLDVDCGEGWLARELAARSIDVVGIDASRALIDIARETGGARFEVCAYADLDANASNLGAPFDAIVCNFALLEEDIAPTLAALRAPMQPGGRLLVQTVHPWSVSDPADYRDGWRTETFAAMGDGFRAAMPWYFRTLASGCGCSTNPALPSNGWRSRVIPEPECRCRCCSPCRAGTRAVPARLRVRVQRRAGSVRRRRSRCGPAFRLQ